MKQNGNSLSAFDQKFTVLFSSFAKRGIMQNSFEIFITNCQNLFSL